jgi:hypothetical protein
LFYLSCHADVQLKQSPAMEAVAARNEHVQPVPSSRAGMHQRFETRCGAAFRGPASDDQLAGINAQIAADALP